MPADSLSRDEEPLAYSRLAVHGTETASEREIVLLTAVSSILFRAAKLDPGVTGPVRIAVHEQIPLDSLGRIGVRFQALRIHFAIQQKRKL